MRIELVEQVEARLTIERDLYYVSHADLVTTFMPQAIAAVPEPGTYALMLAGLAGIGWLVRQRRD